MFCHGPRRSLRTAAAALILTGLAPTASFARPAGTLALASARAATPRAPVEAPPAGGPAIATLSRGSEAAARPSLRVPAEGGWRGPDREARPLKGPATHSEPAPAGFPSGQAPRLRGDANPASGTPAQRLTA